MNCARSYEIGYYASQIHTKLKFFAINFLTHSSKTQGSPRGSSLSVLAIRSLLKGHNLLFSVRASSLCCLRFHRGIVNEPKISAMSEPNASPRATDDNAALIETAHISVTVSHVAK
jgi:hypothetical protein